MNRLRCTSPAECNHACPPTLSSSSLDQDQWPTERKKCKRNQATFSFGLLETVVVLCWARGACRCCCSRRNSSPCINLVSFHQNVELVHKLVRHGKYTHSVVLAVAPNSAVSHSQTTKNTCSPGVRHVVLPGPNIAERQTQLSEDQGFQTLARRC